MASNPMKTREAVLNLLKNSLTEEHVQIIQQECPQYECQDSDDVADDFLCFLEHEEKSICFKSNIFYRLVAILQAIGLDNVARRFPVLEIPEERYYLLKNEIINNFNSKECKKKYFKLFKQNVVFVYGLQLEDIDVCGFTEIIKELENDGLLSRYTLDRFQDVFRRSGCQTIVDLINEAKTMPVEEAMDTTDARAVTATHDQTSQSTQEQNQGTSRQNTYGMGAGEHHILNQTANHHQIAQEFNQRASTSNTFKQGDQGRQPQATFSTGHTVPAGSGFHTQTQPQASFQQAPSFQSSHQPSTFQSPTQTHSRGTVFSANSIGTNINIAPGSQINSLNITTSAQGQDATFSGQMGQHPPYINPNNSFSGHVRQNTPYNPSQNPPPGFLPDEALAYICQNLGTDWRMFGLKLKIDWTSIDKMHAESKDLNCAIMKMLIKWRNLQKPSDQLEIMCKALKDHGNSLLAGNLREFMRR